MKKLIIDLIFGIGGFLIIFFFFKNYYSIGPISIIGIVSGWIIIFLPEIYSLLLKRFRKHKKRK